MEVALGLAVLALAAAATAVLARTRRAPIGLGADRPAVVALLLAAAAALFAVAGRAGVLPGVDLPVLEAAVAFRSGPLTALAEGLSLVGGTVPTALAGVLAALVLWRAGRPRWAAVWVAAVVVGSLVVRFLKLAVERPRPPVATRLAVESTTSLPSGHALMAALGLGLVAAAAPALAGSRPAARLVAGLAVVCALAVGTSRVYLGVHWASDVLAGWLLGAALALIARTAAETLDPAGPSGTEGDDGRADRHHRPSRRGRSRTTGGTTSDTERPTVE